MDTRLTFLPGSSAFSLPGAWPSTDSLEETLSLPNANPNEEPRYIVPDISRSEGIRSRCVSNAAGERSLRTSIATYDDDSDDFYSFVEAQEDDDAEVESSPDPGDILAVPINVENGRSIIYKNPGTTSTSSNPALKHTTSSDNTSSSQRMSVSAPSDQSNGTPQSDYPYSRPTFLTPLTDAVATPRTSLVTSSSRSVHSETSSSGSARFGDEEFSHHLGYSEDESAVSHTQVYSVLDEVHFSDNSEESHGPSSPPRARRSLRIQRRVIVNQDSQLDILHLAQPDGHNPWTLSLDPALVNLSEFANASRSSVSVESSSVAHDVSPSVSPESRLQTPVPPQTPTAPKSFCAAQSELRSRVGRPSVDLLPPHYPSSYSGFTLPHSTEKKDVAQKPKTFYQKMKRFFTPKSSKRNESRGIPNPMSITPLPFSSPYANESSSQWSLNRRAFQRSPKSSAPSVALSCTPDIPYNSAYCPPPGVTRETRRTFEYRRPSTPEVVRYPSKRSRRFSVPTPFYASSLAPSASSSRNISVASSRPFGKRWSRVGESEH